MKREVDLEARTLVLRLDDATMASDGSTVIADLHFLTAHAVRPIVVAPSPDAARSFVRIMNRSSDSAVGLSGADAGMIPAAGADGIGAVQTRLLCTLLANGYVPVIEPIALGMFGREVEVRADEVASAVASATDAWRIIFFHAAGGVMDRDTDALIEELTPAEALALAEGEDLPEDLRAAVRAAARGVRGGVNAAEIVDGRIAHAAIIELLTARHIGTRVIGSVYLGG